MKPSPLEIVGHIDIPIEARKHRFYREAFVVASAVAKNEDDRSTVVGTENNKRCELYGWGANVKPHVDNTGYIYLCMLSVGPSVIHLRCLPGPDVSVEMRRGTVVRMHDYCQHWTEDDGQRICAFVGSYDQPNDEEAIAILAAGAQQLASGSYYDAPRVRDGFRVMLSDECFVGTGPDTLARPMLVEDAKRKGLFIIPCSQCPDPAHHLDHSFPYNWDGNACSRHHIRLSGELAKASIQRLKSVPSARPYEGG